jgi:hypothetical protein
MEPKTIDWTNLGFDIIDTKAVICYTYVNGSWGDVEVLPSRMMNLDLFASGYTSSSRPALRTILF